MKVIYVSGEDGGVGHLGVKMIWSIMLRVEHGEIIYVGINSCMWESWSVYCTVSHVQKCAYGITSKHQNVNY